MIRLHDLQIDGGLVGKGFLNSLSLMVLERITNSRLPPTFRELAQEFDLSVRGVQYHIEILIKAGLVKRGEDNRARTLVATCRFIPAEEL